jgi:hypothetical protein
MAAILDAATMLIPQQLVSTSQAFPAVDVGAVRDLGTASWVIALSTPPVAAVTFVLDASAVLAGPYVELARLVWPAGLTGSRAVEGGVASSLSGAVSASHRFLRVSTTQTGAFTGTSYLTKPTDGSFGLGTKPNSIVTVA